MARVTRGYTEGRYGQLHYYIAKPEKESTLPPLYFLHQSPKSGLEFKTLMEVVGNERIVVAPDYIGYGNSEAPPEEHLATVPAYAECCWQVADALGHTQPISVFGNHTGAKVATAMALVRPDSISKIGMVSAALLTPEERSWFSDYFTPIPLDDEGTRFTTMWERIISRRGPGATLEMMAQSLMMNLLGGEEYEWGHAAAFGYDEPFVEALKTLPHRITILNPADDLTDCTRRAIEIMKNGEVIECPEWGYNFMDVWPEDVAALIRKYV